MELRKYLELNNNKNTKFQNFFEEAEVAVRGKFIALYAYIKK